MKIKAWLQAMVVVCVWLAAVQCVCASNEAGICSFDLPAPFFIHHTRWSASEQVHSSIVHYLPDRVTDLRAVHSRRRLFCRLAEIPSGETDQVIEGLFTDTPVKYVFVRQYPGRANWRLSRPDPLQVNSVIHSKENPPP